MIKLGRMVLSQHSPVPMAGREWLPHGYGYQTNRHSSRAKVSSVGVVGCSVVESVEVVSRRRIVVGMYCPAVAAGKGVHHTST